MCNFISWIEEDGKLLYLTDADVFSKHGRKTLAGALHNDVLGHGAIREFFGIGSRGKEREVCDFWKTELLPAEIAKKVRSFDAHWGKMFRGGNFMDDDLWYIIESAPPAWRNMAAEQLMRQDEDCYYADSIICSARIGDEQKKAAWSKLLGVVPAKSELMKIAYDAKYKWARVAFKELIGHDSDPTICELKYVLENCTPKLRPAVQRAIKELGPE